MLNYTELPHLNCETLLSMSLLMLIHAAFLFIYSLFIYLHVHSLVRSCMHAFIHLFIRHSEPPPLPPKGAHPTPQASQSMHSAEPVSTVPLHPPAGWQLHPSNSWIITNARHLVSEMAKLDDSTVRKEWAGHRWGLDWFSLQPSCPCLYCSSAMSACSLRYICLLAE